MYRSVISSLIMATAVCGVASGCRDLSGLQTLPPGNVAPDEVENAKAAYAMANAAYAQFVKAFWDYSYASGLFTDELQSNFRGKLIGDREDTDILADARITPEASFLLSYDPYADLHTVRGRAAQAIGALAKYAGDSSAARRGYLYAITGYAEIMLADFYCSGVPLSTFDFERAFTYRPGSTTRQVYQHAIALFDTAMTLAADSAPVLNLARVGKGRALLALDSSAAAATIVSAVPADFVYGVTTQCCNYTLSGDRWERFAFSVSVSDNEGGHSPISPSNPRTRANFYGTNFENNDVYVPVRNLQNNIYTSIVASSIEARLIEAEAALDADETGTWLGILNTLRGNDPETASLPPLTDPGDATRIDTLLSERAQWLFFTGHRQGDLRRLLRKYPARSQRTVYPSGPYPGTIGNYGNEVNFPIPKAERNNPFFQGCIDRRA